VALSDANGDTVQTYEYSIIRIIRDSHLF